MLSILSMVQKSQDDPMKQLTTLVLSAIAAVPTAADDNPAWPEHLSVTCGDLVVNFEGPKRRWTIENIRFRDVLVAPENGASGTVFNFPDIGFIGTAHHENEVEPVDDLAFFLDGKKLEDVPAEVSGQSFRLQRKSHVKEFALEGEVELRDNRIWETATFRLPTDADPVPLKLVYHFMHPWHVDSTHYMAGRDGEIIASGELDRSEEANRKFYVNTEADWIAIYNAKTKTYLVSYLLEKPDVSTAIAAIWNVHGAYRKFYLRCFTNDTVPSGFDGTYQMVTGFGVAEEAEWEESARTMADNLAATR
jgi:hypothetical protein